MSKYIWAYSVFFSTKLLMLVIIATFERKRFSMFFNLCCFTLHFWILVQTCECCLYLAILSDFIQQMVVVWGIYGPYRRIEFPCWRTELYKLSTIRRGTQFVPRKDFMRHIVQLKLPTRLTYQRQNAMIMIFPLDQVEGVPRNPMPFTTQFGCLHWYSRSIVSVAG